ncbi:MAG: tetratricopeptide repeat protein [Acidobacteriota bacterium]
MNFISMPNNFAHQRKITFLILIISLVFSLTSVCFAQEVDEAKDPVKIFYQGQEAHEKGDLQTALKLYDEALKIVPEFPEAEYQRGTALLSLGKRDEAEKSFRRALELRANWTLPMTSLGALLLQKNNFAEAEKLLTKAAESDDKNFLAFSALAELRIKTKANINILKELLGKIQILTGKANPTASIWAARAALENALGDKTAAKTSLNRAFEIEPKNKSALMQRAEIALIEGDKTTAANIVETLFQIAPKATDTKILQARIYAANANADEAVKVLDSIENPSSEVSALRDNIEMNGSINVEDLEKHLKQDEKNAVVLGRLCTLLRKENPIKALDYCRRASEAEPNNLNHAVGYGAALVQAQKYEDAISLFRRLLQISPDNYMAHANLATALFQLKRYEEAIPEFFWLAEKQPDLPITYYFLAISHDSLGKYMDAMANYQQFLRIADAAENKLEIEKVNLRLPSLQKLIKQNKGKNK